MKTFITPFPTPLPSPTKHTKKAFVKEVGFKGRGGADWKAKALFQVSEQVWRKCKITSGKIKHPEV